MSETLWYLNTTHFILLPFSSSDWQKLHPQWVWPRRCGSLSPQFPVKAYLIALRGKVIRISHPFQLHVEEAKFLVSVAERLGATFFHPAPIHRLKTRPHTGKVENTWTKTALPPVYLRKEVASCGEASWEDHMLPPCPVPRAVAQLVQGKRQSIGK